jgi:hypothetical protein
MPALTVTSAWQSRTLAEPELWQCWSGVLQVNTAASDVPGSGVQLFGGDSQNCAISFPSGATIHYRTAHGPCIAGYIVQA